MREWFLSSSEHPFASQMNEMRLRFLAPTSSLLNRRTITALF